MLKAPADAVLVFRSKINNRLGAIMPIRSIRTLTRPNTTVKFYESSAEWKTYLKETYQNTGLQTSVQVSHSNGGTVATVTAIWKDQAAFNSYMNDPKVQQLFFNPRDEYSSANGIVITDFRSELL